MVFFTWTAEYTTGVAIIDQQHQRLVEILNELYTAVIEIRGQDVIGKVIQNMAEYASTHFKTEENLMLQYGYPGYPENKKEHEDFLMKTAELQEKSKKDDFILSVDLLKYLKDWLQHHILEIDMAYKPFFQSKGVK